jgi:hypothetical protein
MQNIKSFNGSMIHIQKSENQTMCGIKLIRKIYNKTTREYDIIPYYEIVDLNSTCPKCNETEIKKPIKTKK